MKTRVALALCTLVASFTGIDCTAYAPGIQQAVEFHVQGLQGEDQNGDLSAFLTIQEVALNPCPEGEEAQTWFRAWATPRAFAHSTTTRTRIGTPTVVSLSQSSSTNLGWFYPSPGRYCSVTLRLGPADADAQDLPAEANMVGRSLRIEGSLPPEAQEPRVQLESSSTFVVTLQPATPWRWDAVEHSGVLEINLSTDPLRSILLDDELRDLGPGALLWASITDALRIVSRRKTSEHEPR